MTDIEPALDRQADIATDVSIAALEAAISAVKGHGPNLSQDEAIGILTGLLRAAGRWASFTIPAELDGGIQQMMEKVMEQERRARNSHAMGGVQ